MAIVTYKENTQQRVKKLPTIQSSNNLLKEPLSIKASARDQLKYDGENGSEEYIQNRDSLIFQTLQKRDHDTKSVIENHLDGESDINPPGRQAYSQISSSRAKENPTQKVMIQNLTKINKQNQINTNTNQSGAHVSSSHSEKQIPKINQNSNQFNPVGRQIRMN
jgi:hypothetical protein